MKIIYIVKTQLHYYPPCISQIRMIKDLNYDIEVLYGTSNESALKLLEGEGISCYKIADIKDIAKNMTDKLREWYKYRCGVLRFLQRYSKEDTVLWFGTAESILPMLGKLRGRKYILSLLELLDDNLQKVRLLKTFAKNAAALTVCEETRGYIMKYWWNLQSVPYVMPNKPYNQITDANHTPSIAETKAVINEICGKRVILYQGILQNTDEILEVAKALKEIDSDYILLLMGIDKYNSVAKIKEIYDKVVYVSYIPAPYHLEITSYAHIGIVFYRNDSLNKVFCAPNKIYEYSGFGIPMLANDIPGLKNTVGNAGAAECMEFNKNNIINAIMKIENNYDCYSSKARKFFENTDNLKTMQILLESVIK